MPEPSGRLTRAAAGVIDPNPARKYLAALDQADWDSKQEKEAALASLREQRKARREEEKAAREKAKADEITAEEVRIESHKKALAMFEEASRQEEDSARASAVNPSIPTFANAAVVSQAFLTRKCGTPIQRCSTELTSPVPSAHNPDDADSDLTPDEDEDVEAAGRVEKLDALADGDGGTSQVDAPGPGDMFAIDSPSGKRLMQVEADLLEDREAAGFSPFKKVGKRVTIASPIKCVVPSHFRGSPDAFFLQEP